MLHSNDEAAKRQVIAIFPYAGQSKSGRIWTNFKKRNLESRCIGRDWAHAARDMAVASGERLAFQESLLTFCPRNAKPR